MRVTRTDWTDFYVDGGEPGESAVFVDGTVVVLSGLATALVSAVPSAGVGDQRLVEVLVSMFGHPTDGDAADVTEAAVRDLVDSGVLRREVR